jgi:predicted ATPase
MIQIPGHVVSEKLHESDRTVVFRGHRESDGTSVAFKCTRAEFPRAADIWRLRHEHTVLSSIDAPNVLRSYGIERCGNGLALVLEQFDGIPLTQLIRDGHLSLRMALKVGSALAETLSGLHRKHMVHKDVKPHNVLVDVEREQVVLIDFGIATWLTRETQRATTPDDLEGSLAYMSPEQTGRINRMIDHRADLYSLGVTLYEAVTGQLPFSATDPLDYIHSHIARVPTAPHEVNSNVPPVVSDIILRLLEKTPDNRYQHASGLKSDLDGCLQRLDARGHVQSFELGHADLSDQLNIPQKLYGREQERETLLGAFDRVKRGDAELFVISGYAGVGKSALARELEEQVTHSRGYFVTGKLDQLASSRPYAAVGEAFNRLVRHVLAESPESQARWKQRLLKALGSNAQILIDLAPDLETLLGPQPAVEDLGPTEAQNRMMVVVQDFLRAFTADGRPVVLFLDDLQWADPGSLKLLRLILTDSESHHLLVLGAYRDNEVDAGHPLTLALDEIRKAGANIEMIAVRPLQLEHVTEFVADALEADPERIEPLTKLILDKTHGNPLFVTQYLSSLHDENLLTFNRKEGEWTWHIESIRQSTMAEGILDFMVDRLRRLPEPAQQALQLGACIGHEFNLSTLAAVSEQSNAGVAERLWEPLREGYILPLDPEYRFLYAAIGTSDADEGASEQLTNFDPAFRFLHDRAQQAAYALIDESERGLVHLRIGRLLLDYHDREPTGSALFQVANHLSAGLDQITDESEKLTTAQLFLEAGTRSKKAAAHETAVRYFQLGQQCLDDSAWNSHYGLMYSLHVERGESEFIIGNRENADTLFDTALERSQNHLDKARILNLRTNLHTSVAGDYPGAQKYGREGLALFDVKLPDESDLQQALGEQLQQLPQNLGDRRIEDLVDAPLMEDPDQKMIQTLLTSLLPSSFLTNPYLYAYVIVRNVNISLLYGNQPDSLVGYVSLGYFQAGVLQQFDDAYKFGKLAIDLAEKLNIVDVRASLYFLFAGYNHFYEHPDNTLEYFARGRQWGFEVGDFQYLAFTTYCTWMIRFGRGDSMPAVREQAEGFLKLMNRAQDSLSTQFLHVVNQVVKNVEGRTKGRLDLSDDQFDEAEYEQMLQDQGNYFVSCFLWTYKAQICFQHGEYEKALAYADKAEENVGSGAGLYFTTELCLFTALICAAVYDSASDEQKPKLRERVKTQLDQMKTWASCCAHNFEQKALLMEAELARIDGQELQAMNLYEEAISKSYEHEFPRDEALANELAGRFHRAAGRKRIARPYLANAYYGYSR